MRVYGWPQSHWSGLTARNEELRLVQLFSADEESFGRELGAAHGWLEVVRSDARPYFEEAVTPPGCPDWTSGEPYRQQECWTGLHKYGGGRFPPGCWARPAVGTGVWINAGRTIRAHDLDDWKAIFNTSKYDFGEWPNALDFTLFARNQGIDTLQFTFGDSWKGLNPPPLIVTSDSCVGRRTPLRACLPVEARAGWADLPESRAMTLPGS